MKKYISPLAMWLLFETIGMTLWLTLNTIFYKIYKKPDNIFMCCQAFLLFKAIKPFTVDYHLFHLKSCSGLPIRGCYWRPHQ